MLILGTSDDRKLSLYDPVSESLLKLKEEGKTGMVMSITLRLRERKTLFLN